MQFKGTHECIEVPRRQHRVLLRVERSLLHGRQLSRTFLQWTGNLARCYPFFQWHVCIVILPKGLVLIQVTTGFCQIATGLEGIGRYGQGFHVRNCLNHTPGIPARRQTSCQTNGAFVE